MSDEILAAKRQALVEADEIRKQIFQSHAVIDLKIKNLGFYYQLDSEFRLRTGLTLRTPDLELLKHYLENPDATIEELLPRRNGWKY